MNADPQQPPASPRATVVTLTPRGQKTPPAARPPAPSRHDHADGGDEPGYGHGV